MTAPQNEVLETILSAWEGVCVYDTEGVVPGTGTVLIVGHKGSEYHFSLVNSDGTRHRINDPLNQSHWLTDIHSGRIKLVKRAS